MAVLGSIDVIAQRVLARFGRGFVGGRGWIGDWRRARLFGGAWRLCWGYDCWWETDGYRCTREEERLELAKRISCEGFNTPPEGAARLNVGHSKIDGLLVHCPDEASMGSQRWNCGGGSRAWPMGASTAQLRTGLTQGNHAFGSRCDSCLLVLRGRDTASLATLGPTFCSFAICGQGTK